MIKPSFTLFAFLILLIGCKSPQNEKAVSKDDTTCLLLEDLTSQYIDLYNCPTDTIVDLDSLVLKLSIKDCRGELSFILSDKQANKRIEGQYINSLDTLKIYSIGKSAITGEKSRTVLKYFQPIPSGKWFYFRTNGKIDTVFYKNGFEATP